MIRTLLRQLRTRTTSVSLFASRFNRITRYGFNLILWTRLLGKGDPIPLEFPQNLLERKGVAATPPSLHVSGPPAEVACWETGFAAVNAALLLNLQTPDILSAVRYAHPAPAFRGVYLWDSAFISQIWKSWDPAVAQDVNRAVIQLRDQDRLQHVVADFVESAYTQPPVLAWAIWQVAQALPTAEAELFLHETFPALVAYHAWLYQARRLPNGLFFWAHPYESGIDNSPRFSSRDESQFADTRKLASPDLCAYVVLQNESLAKTAEKLGDGRAARQFQHQADELRQQMNETLWHEGDGLYYDWHIERREHVRAKTIASLLPLWAGVPDVQRTQRLREHILCPTSFGSPIPLPSVALDDPAFCKDMWRGPVWINVAYAVILGLERYSFDDDAADLAFRLCEGVYRTYHNCRHIYEFYDPQQCHIEELDRKLGNRWKLLTLGGKPVSEFVGWSGLVNTLVIEHLIGFRRCHERRLLKPRLPSQACGWAFSLRLPAEGLSLDLEVDRNGQVRVTKRSGDGVATRQMVVGETLDLDAMGPEGQGTDRQPSREGFVQGA